MTCVCTDITVYIPSYRLIFLLTSRRH